MKFRCFFSVMFLIFLLFNSSNFSTAAHIEENQGLKLDIPDDIFPLVKIEKSKDPNDIFRLSELGSVESAKKIGMGADGAGWIFTIAKVSKDEIYKILQGDTFGAELFAYKNNDFYLYKHPTDVRYMRENNELMERDQAVWTKVNEWGYEKVRKSFIKDNNLSAITDGEFRDANFKNGDRFIGGWHESIAGRAHIDIQKIGKTYHISIHWGESAAVSNFWNMTAKFKNGALIYDDCEYKKMEFSENNNSKIKRHYKNGRGSFKILATGELVWNDITSNAGNNSVFLRD